MESVFESFFLYKKLKKEQKEHKESSRNVDARLSDLDKSVASLESSIKTLNQKDAALQTQADKTDQELAGIKNQISTILDTVAELQLEAQKGTLLVNVSGAVSAAPLNYTITLTPQSDGKAISKSGSGTSGVLFQGVMKGQYTLSFSSVNNYSKPSNQTITVEAGKTKTVSAAYTCILGEAKISVSADIVLKPLNYTLTLKPVSGGSAVTQTGRGAGDIVFKNLPSGQYTLTGNTVSGYSTPSSQRITVYNSQLTKGSLRYIANVSFSSATWAEIDKVSKAGMASSKFRTYDTKTFTTKDGMSLTAQIIGFNHDDLTSGGKAGISMCLENYAYGKRVRAQEDVHSSDSLVGGYNYSFLREWLNDTQFSNLPNDLQSAIKVANKPTMLGSNVNGVRDRTIYNLNDKLWLLSAEEVFGAAEATITTVHYGTFTDLVHSREEGSQYEAFKSPSRRIKSASSGISYDGWNLRSSNNSSRNGVDQEDMIHVDNYGNENITPGDGFNSKCERGVIFGFCI